jgi:hypothetical protein
MAKEIVKLRESLSNNRPKSKIGPKAITFSFIVIFFFPKQENSDLFLKKC